MKLSQIVKLGLAFLLVSSFLVFGVTEKADAYTQKRYKATYNCKKGKVISNAKVRATAKKMERATSGASYVSLGVGWFNKQLGAGLGALAISMGNNTSTWAKNGAAGKRIQQDVCIKKTPHNKSYGAPFSYTIERWR
ncbi:hypothetical protein P3U41_05515 [Mammaliicoccus sciuri]|uniref:hypothetical protein n=1 Tax=Mammaliicoccus sciuri TaxID=1296 RepID=UPI002B25FA7B|nr:hypothetical protein [Mammaliicoccus sciuri]WQL34228.1 hypothetical protein P3U41_05515 [Mammaliicoccus sciuri]WQL61167.1 hypothetical protein P3T96_05515 [Mammaliicoccus sciuri]